MSSLPERVYRVLLRAYPREFRRLYADDMTEAFLDLRAREADKGRGARIRLWVATALDTIRTGLSERASRRGYRRGRSLLRIPRMGLAQWVADLSQDLAYALRSLGRARGYAAVVVVTLALGIGATTALFSVAWGVLLKPLPFGSGERLVRLVQEHAPATDQDQGSRRMGFSVKDLRDFGSQTPGLEAVAEYHRMSFSLVDGDGPHEISAGVVSSNFFEFLGLRPLKGRLFDPVEDHLGADPVLVLSYEYWQKHWGGDPRVVGREVRMNGAVHRIVGVLGPTSQFPDRNDVYLPISVCPIRSSPDFMADRQSRMMYAYARLRPGVSVAEVRGELHQVAEDLEQRYPAAYDLPAGYDIDAVPLRDEMVATARPVVVALLAVSGLVLLIACANAASLALARGNRRSRELAVRTAMGAGRGRLVRALVTESVLLALAGGILGLALALAGHDVLVRFAARFTTRAGEIRLDRVIFAFALGTSVLTGLIFGAVPGLLAGRDPRATLLDSGGPSTPGGRNRRAQGLLVTVQVAVAFGVLAAAGLMLRSAWAVSRAGVGFTTESVASMRVALGGLRYRARSQSDSFFAALQTRMLAHAAVKDVARTMGTPFEGGHDHRDAFFIRSPDGREQTSGVGLWRGAGADVFRVLRVPVLRGRGFGVGDSLGAPRVALVNQTFYRRYLEGVAPLGSELVRCNTPDDCDAPMRVVGVVADARYDGPDQVVLPEVYQPAAQLDWGGETLLIRLAGDARAIGPELVSIVHDLDPDVPVSQFAPLDQLRRESTASRRFLALILSLFAVVAVGLAVAGIFGVASLAATARLQELGIRRALGAAPGSLEGLVVREAFRVVIPGLLAGGLAALVLDTFLARFVWGVAPHDPLTLTVTAVLFLGAAVVASWLPARRASRVDVMTTLNAP